MPDGLCTQTFYVCFRGGFEITLSHLFLHQIGMETICQPVSKLNREKSSEAFIEIQPQTQLFVSVVPNSSITVSKVYSRKTSDKAVIQQSCFLDVLSSHTNIMTGKWSYFDEYAARMCTSALSGRKAHPFFLRGLKCRHLAAQDFRGK